MTTLDGFGTRLRSARLEAGMSQTALEHATGVPKARLSRYENGYLLPSLPTLTLLCSALGISHSDLAGEPSPRDRFVSALAERGFEPRTVRDAETLAAEFARFLASSRRAHDGGRSSSG